MRDVTTNQMCAIIFILTIGNKLLILPSLLYSHGGNDSLLFITLILLVDFLFVLLFAKTNNIKNIEVFTNRCKRVLGKPIAIFVFLLFSSYFLFKTFLTLKETENFLNTTIYTNLPSELFILPIMLVVLYVVYNGRKNIARVIEVFSFFVIIGIIAVLFLSVQNIEIDGILPLFTAKNGTFLDMFLCSAMWLGNYFLMFLFIGNVRIERHSTRRYLISYLFSALSIIILFWVFYSLFTYSSVVHHFAIADVTYFAPKLASLGKFDWFTVLFYGFAVVLQLILQIFIVIKLLENVFNKSFKFSFYAIFCVVSILLYAVLPVGFNDLLNLSSNVLSYGAVALNILSPILFILLYIKDNIKNSKKIEKRLIYSVKGDIK